MRGARFRQELVLILTGARRPFSHDGGARSEAQSYNEHCSLNRLMISSAVLLMSYGFRATQSCDNSFAPARMTRLRDLEAYGAVLVSEKSKFGAVANIWVLSSTLLN